MKKITATSLFSNVKEKLSSLKKRSGRFYRTIFALGVTSLSSSRIFATPSTTLLDNDANAVLQMITGTPLKVVMILAVILCFGLIAWGQSQGEGGMFKKVIPIVVGLIGIGSAATIVAGFISGPLSVSK